MIPSSRIGVIAALAFAAAACSSRSSPVTPTNPQAPTCRAIPASYNRSDITGSRTFSTVTGACSFDRTLVQLTCVENYSDIAGFRNTSTQVTSYQSLDDVLMEVAVIPPLKRLIGMVVTNTNEPGSSLVISYDTQRRPTQQIGSTGITITYTAWDAVGRPTQASTMTDSGIASTESYSYNDAGRTMTTTSGTGVSASVCAATFDANGNQISVACPPGGTSNSTTAIVSTQQVCK